MKNDKYISTNGFLLGNTSMCTCSVNSTGGRMKPLTTKQRTELYNWIADNGNYIGNRVELVVNELLAFLNANTEKRVAHSKSEYRRLKAQGVDVQPPDTSCESRKLAKIVKMKCPFCNSSLTRQYDKKWGKWYITWACECEPDPQVVKMIEREIEKEEGE